MAEYFKKHKGLQVQIGQVYSAGGPSHVTQFSYK